jgi:leucyl aminopeptidase
LRWLNFFDGTEFSAMAAIVLRPDVPTLATDDGRPAARLTVLDKAALAPWLLTQAPRVQALAKSFGFEREGAGPLIVPMENGAGIEAVATLVADAADPFALAALAASLPEGAYRIEAAAAPAPGEKAETWALGWALAAYRFERYRSKPAPKAAATLLLADAAAVKRVQTQARAAALVRDLVNTPANDLGPGELADSALALMEELNGTAKIIRGEELLRENFPAIYEVGKASVRPPCLIDLKFGDETHPKLTLVGKGVVFDTGGLDIKPSSAMRLMKKDMGGAAHALALAYLVLSRGLKVRLRVLIPAVENAVSGNAFRPGDVIASRKGSSIEVGNTDAEGRLILADALEEAGRDSPSLLIDFATLTGAARVALGPDLPALFATKDDTANGLLASAAATADPLWRLPLWQAYRPEMKSGIADISSTGMEGFAGAITAALFLQHFVPDGQDWLHLDLYAWNRRTRPGRPEGGEAMALRALVHYLEKRFAAS